jgi:hypothetical protein
MQHHCYQILLNHQCKLPFSTTFALVLLIKKTICCFSFMLAKYVFFLLKLKLVISVAYRIFIELSDQPFWKIFRCSSRLRAPPPVFLCTWSTKEIVQKVHVNFVLPSITLKRRGSKTIMK